MMLPWVALGIILAVSLLISVIYTAVMFFIAGDVLNGVFWIVFGPLAVGTMKCRWNILSASNYTSLNKVFDFSNLHLYVVCRLQSLRASEAWKNDNESRPLWKTLHLWKAIISQSKVTDEILPPMIFRQLTAFVQRIIKLNETNKK